MATQRDRPYTQFNFLVDFGAGNARGTEAGFCEVVFPDFRIDGGDRRLILRRGATGTLESTDGGIRRAMNAGRTRATLRFS